MLSLFEMREVKAFDEEVPFGELSEDFGSPGGVADLGFDELVNVLG